MAADRLADDTKVLENRIDGGAIYIEVDSEIDRRPFRLPDQLRLFQRGLCIGGDFRLGRTGIFQTLQEFLGKIISVLVERNRSKGRF